MTKISNFRKWNVKKTQTVGRFVVEDAEIWSIGEFRDTLSDIVFHKSILKESALTQNGMSQINLMKNFFFTTHKEKHFYDNIQVISISYNIR
jgi:hypothetical protein